MFYEYTNISKTGQAIPYTLVHILACLQENRFTTLNCSSLHVVPEVDTVLRVATGFKCISISYTVTSPSIGTIVVHY